jgi:hypothetical protein
MNNPRSITLPPSRPATYPCETINKVISEDTLPALTAAERRCAYGELLQALSAIQIEIQVATDKAVLPVSHINYQAMDQRWLSRAKILRSAVGSLLWQIRQYDRSLAPHAIEVEAIEMRRKADRRHSRQQYYVDAFTDLVAEEIGEDRLIELLKQAGAEADEWMQNTYDTGKKQGWRPGVLRQAINF